MAIDKLVVSHRQNLLAKYGSDLSLIQAAVSKWIQADWVKGIQSKLVYLDVVADVGLNGMAVVSGTEKEFKDVIDALFKEHTPDYLVILGAPDIVPHQTLTNPAENDGDDTIPSDLPYAGDAPFGDNPCTFLGASRVVGRLPDLNGVKDAPYLVGLIERAAAATPRMFPTPPSFVVSSDKFADQTRISVDRAFGPSTPINIVPPKTTPWPPAQLASVFHFFNCEGFKDDSHWAGTNDVEAQITSKVSGQNLSGVVIAAECCYSAQLYSPSADRDMPICNAYLGAGAWGVWGSTTFCYGTLKNCEASDLLSALFMCNVLHGASLGRAALQARQTLIQSSILCHAAVKAMAQFLLLGDPSITPVLAPDLGTATALGSNSKILPPLEVEQFERNVRRTQLAQTGKFLSQTAFRYIQIPTPSAVEPTLRKLARDNGMDGPLNITTLDVHPATQDIDRIYVIFLEVELANGGKPSKMLEVGQSGADPVWVRFFVPRQ